MTTLLRKHITFHLIDRLIPPEILQGVFRLSNHCKYTWAYRTWNKIEWGEVHFEIDCPRGISFASDLVPDVISLVQQ
jgi:hypothetical protein